MLKSAKEDERNFNTEYTNEAFNAGEHLKLQFESKWVDGNEINEDEDEKDDEGEDKLQDDDDEGIGAAELLEEKSESPEKRTDSPLTFINKNKNIHAGIIVYI